jgi:hypothetical protein
VGERGPHGPERAEQVDLNRARERLGVDHRDRAEGRDAGVGPHHVEPAQPGDGALGRLLHRLEVGDVGGDRLRLKRGCGFLQRHLVEVDEREPGAAGVQRLRGRRADPAGAAGDEERPVVERPARHADNPIPLDTRGNPRP